MPTPTPLDQPCPHLATPQEQERDPAYQACNAPAGQPCRWARRHDGITNPTFHTERLEGALPITPQLAPEQAAAFRECVLETGLV